MYISDRESCTFAWALERSGKRDAFGVRWQPYVEPAVSELECKACGTVSYQEAVFDYRDGRLFMCRGCGSHRFSGASDLSLPGDAFAAPFDLYRRIGPSLGGWTSCLDRLLSRRKARRFLDMGCGCGLALELAARRGWRVAGMRSGDVIPLHLPSEPELITSLDGEIFDAIFGAFTLSRATDPADWLKSALNALSADGNMLLLVPDIASLYEGNREGYAEFLATQPDRFLPSEAGIRELFRRIGYPPPLLTRVGDLMLVEISGRGSRSIFDRIRPRRAPKPLGDWRVAEDSYLDDIRSSSKSAELRLIADVRFLCREADAGHWERLVDVRQRLAPFIDESVTISGSRSIADDWRSRSNILVNAPFALYFEAMASLNHDTRPDRAAILFGATAALLKSMPEALLRRLEEGNMRYNALFHQALAFRACGHDIEARKIAREVIAAGDAGEHWKHRAAGEILDR